MYYTRDAIDMAHTAGAGEQFDARNVQQLLDRLVTLQSQNSSLIGQLRTKNTEYERITDNLLALEKEVHICWYV